MDADSERTPTGSRPSRGELLGPQKVLKLFVQIQEDAKIKNGLALIKNAPSPD